MTKKKNAPASAATDEAPKQSIQEWMSERLMPLLPTIRSTLPQSANISAEKFVQMCASYLLVQDRDAGERRDRSILRGCQPISWQRCVQQAAELGLVPGSALGQVHFIPYAGNAQLMVGVWGYVALARRSGQITDVWADVIYEADEVQVLSGLERSLVHRPSWQLDPEKSVEEGGRGKVIGAYAVAQLKDGTRSWTLLNSRDLDQVRKASKSPTSPAWKDWPDEMHKRSAIKRARKTWPLSVESEGAIARAIQFEEEDDAPELVAANAPAALPAPGMHLNPLDSFMQEEAARSAHDAAEDEDQRPAEEQANPEEDGR